MPPITVHFKNDESRCTCDSYVSYFFSYLTLSVQFRLVLVFINHSLQHLNRQSRGRLCIMGEEEIILTEVMVVEVMEVTITELTMNTIEPCF